MTLPNLPETIERRADGIERWVEALEADLEALVETLDGLWPASMLREGFRDHVRTWEAVERLVDGLRRELGAFGGFEALDSWSTTASGASLRVRPPSEVVHLWPSLPGTGVTPMLYGALLGVEQAVRPAEGTERFARRLVDLWNRIDDLPPLDVQPSGSDRWTEAEVVVVSGTDETLREVRRRIASERRGRATTVTGYGHRVSMGAVPETLGGDLVECAREMARDAVLWNQAGCFSLRGVLVAGPADQREAFCEHLGRAIADWEQRLDAVPDEDSDGALGIFERRMQARQIAEFRGRIYGDGFGWVEERTGPFRGDWISLHTVTCHPVDGPSDVSDAVDIDRCHLQAVARPDSPNGARWDVEFADAGFTRVGSPGRLQAPPPDWLHDGRLNVGEWLAATTRDGAERRGER